MTNGILFFDTETTGKANFKLPADHPSQPRMVQLAAILTNAEGRKVASLACMIKPDAWIIPPEAEAIHGISTEHATLYGLPLVEALTIFDTMIRRASLLVAHNIDFDSLIVESESSHLARGKLLHLPSFCTMRASTEIVGIPSPYYRGQFKWPTLGEAYKHFIGRDLVDAHDAMSDASACAEIYFAMTRQTATGK